MSEKERGKRLLDAVYDEIDQQLNPDGDECWHCGGVGGYASCQEDCCPSIGGEEMCDDPACWRPCLECRTHAGRRAKLIREAVIKDGDLDLAIAWIKSVGRWREGITREHVQQELAAARDATPARIRA